MKRNPGEKLFLIFGWKTNQIETKIKFTYSQRRVGNLQYCKREKQKRHIINIIISMIFLVNSLEGQKDSFKNTSMWAKNLALKSSRDTSNMYLVADICLLLSYL